MKGQGNPQAKFTSAQVAEIRARYAAGGIGYIRLGREFVADWETIRRIVKHVTYKDEQ
jgi:hypothetical protein